MALSRKLLEHPLRRGGLPLGCLYRARNFKALEQDLLQLLGRIQVERPFARHVRRRDGRGDGFGEFPALPVQHVRVNQHAAVLHLLQHRNQRLFDFGVEPFQVRDFAQPPAKRPVKAQGDIGVLGGVLSGDVDVHLVEADLPGALARDLFVPGRRYVQVPGGYRVHVVARGGGVEHERFEHGVVGHAAEADTVIEKHVGVVLQVMPDFFRGAFQPRLEALQDAFPGQLLRGAGITVRQGDIGGAQRLHGQ